MRCAPLRPLPLTYLVAVYWLAPVADATATDLDFRWVSPSPQGNDLWGIDFATSTIGYAVGTNGALVRTEDGGLTWTDLGDFTRLPNDLTSVVALSPDTLIVSGETPGLFKSEDGGATWRAVANVLYGGVHDVARVEPGILSALGPGLVLRSVDGGETWTSREIPEHPALFRAQHWFDDSTGVIVGDLGGYRTTNGGDTWEPVVGLDPLWGYLSLAFGDALHGVVGGWYFDFGWFGDIWVTADGGRTWEYAESTALPLSLVALSPDHYLMGCNYSEIRESLDGGHSWQIKLRVPGNVFFHDMLRQSDGTLRAVGQAGHLLYSIDEGVNWVHASSCIGGPTRLTISDFQFPTASAGFGLVGGDLMRSVDSGETWDILPGPLQRCGVLAFRDSSWGVLAGARRPDGLAQGSADTIAVTSDGGESWAFIEYNPSLNLGLPAEVRDFTMVPGSNVIFAALWVDDTAVRGSVMRSPDGGLSWERRDGRLPRDISYECIDFISTDVGFVAGLLGRIYRTNDAGRSWSEIWPNQDHDPTVDMVWLNELTGFIARKSVIPWGYPGLFRTEDGGQSWTFVCGGGVLDIDFRNSTHGAAIRQSPVPPSDNMALVTHDGGINWDQVVIPMQHWGSQDWPIGASGVAVVPDGILVSGDVGGILRATQTTTAVEIDAPQAQPSLLRLGRRIGDYFPISFRLPAPGTANLRVFDVRGRLIDVLASGVFPGGQEVAFVWTGRPAGGPRMAPGVYYVQLRTRHANETASLVLVR